MLDKTETKLHFESLSFFDLLKVAESYDIDVPENLDRNFLVAELLEASAELEAEASGTADAGAQSQKLAEIEEEDFNYVYFGDIDAKMLPKTYNVNDIGVVLRTPVWAFVFWNVSESVWEEARNNPAGQNSFALRVCFFEDRLGQKLADSFEILVGAETCEQHVLLQHECRYFSVELGLKKNDGIVWLARSRVARKPAPDAIKKFARTGNRYELSEVLELSGCRNLLRSHYMNHRQIFE